jgi:versiconal hemiacetal acetate esterase
MVSERSRIDSLEFSLPRIRTAENTVNTAKVMHAMYEIHGAPKNDPYIFSLQHGNLKALPRVYMNACGADTLRDDARLMKEILDKNG